MNSSGIELCGVRIDAADYPDIIDASEHILAQGGSGIITYSHFHTLLEARRDDVIRSVLNGATLNHPDGVGVAWALRLIARRGTPRINGTDLYPMLIGRFAEQGRAIFFLGGSPETGEALRSRFAELAPASLQEGGPRLTVHHGSAPVDDRSVLDAIAEAAPDVLFIGLGSPKQYQWLHRHRDELHVPLIILVGGGIEFLSGRRPRAPRWMRVIGLEWVHRLLREPGNVWRRYVIGIPRFGGVVLRELIRGRNAEY